MVSNGEGVGFTQSECGFLATFCCAGTALLENVSGQLEWTRWKVNTNTENSLSNNMWESARNHARESQVSYGCINSLLFKCRKFYK
jgi:hypothetical protein